MKILDKKSKILRQIAKEVSIRDIHSAKVGKVIEEMSATLATHDDGVAIAAPQIGVSLRIFTLSPKFFPHEKSFVFINPKIVKISKKKVTLDEGCLSVRWMYGKTKRSEKATVEAYDENGRKFT